MGSVVIAFVTAALASAWSTRISNTPIAVSPDDGGLVAATVRDGVRVFRLSDGVEVATIPFRARDVAWEGGRLYLLERERVAVWEPGALGTEVEIYELPGSRERVVGADGLVYSWDPAEASVLDPVTGLSAPLWRADPGHPILAASRDGFLDAAGFHGWDGRLRFAVNGPSDDCFVAEGPIVWCRAGTRATVYSAHAAPRHVSGRLLAWREGWSITRADKVAHLHDPAGVEVASAPGLEVAQLDGDFAVVRTQAEAPTPYVPRPAPDLTVWALGPDGTATQRLHVPLERIDRLEVPGSTPVLLVESEKDTRILAREDGRTLGVLGLRAQSAAVREDRLVVALHQDFNPTPSVVSYEDGVWLYQPVRGTTRWTLRRAADGSRVCGPLVAFYGRDGPLAAYDAADGAQRFSVPAGPGDRVVACTADRWLVSDGVRWRVLDARRGAVLYEGEGKASGAAFPAAVVVGDQKHRRLFGPTGELPVPEGFEPVLAVGDGVLLSSGAQRALVDARGVRWRVHTTLAISTHAEADGRVYLAGSTLTLALDARTGALVWATPAPEARAQRIVVVGP